MDLPEHLILFDGHCHLCNNSVKTILKFDSEKKFYFASLQSPLGLQLVQKHKSETPSEESIIYLKNGNFSEKSEAVLWIASQLKFPINLAAGLIIFPPFIRNRVYTFIAKNRYKWFGKSDSCLLPDPEYKNRFIDL